MEKNKKSLPKKLGLFAFVFVSVISALTLIVGLGTKTFKNTVEKPDLLDAGDVPSHNKGLVENGDGTYKLSLDVTGESREKLNKVNVIVVLDTSGSMRYPTENTSATGRYGFALSSSGDYFRALYTRNNNGTYSELTNNDYTGTVYTRSGRAGNYTYTEYTGPRYTSNSTNYTTRMTAAKSAVNDLANVLLSKNGTGDKADLVEMSLVGFATTASTQNFTNSGSRRNITTSYDNFSTRVNALNANGGTNWEAALTNAEAINFGDSDTTYVIFVSDGNPTFRNTAGNYNPMDNAYYNSDGVYGNGSDSAPVNGMEPSVTIGRCYDHALDNAQGLVTNGYQFYTIGAYGDVSRMQSLTTSAGAPAGNYFSAANTEELKSALNTILDAITKEGIGAVSINDGTTQKVSVSSELVVNLLEVDESSYQYFKDGQPWEGAPEAHLENGAVKWDLESVGVLDNGVTYKVTFDVYPSQYTNDLITDLKNGEVEYSELQATTGPYAGLAQYIVKDGNEYYLRTNTTATLKYKDTRLSDEYQEPVTYRNPDPVITIPDQITMHKVWENDYDAKRVEKIDIDILRDGSHFYTVSLKDPSWTAGPVNISSGLMRVHYAADETTITGIEVLNKGHDYTYNELGEESYNWEMVAETVHPMVINNQLKELILIDDAVTETYTTGTTSLPHYTIPAAMLTEEGKNLTFYQEGGKNYYRLDNSGKVYVETTSTQPTVEAYNFRRSNLNISKIVDGESAPADDTFEFTIKVNDQGLSSGEDLWFSVWDGDYVVLGERLESEGWTKYVNEKGETYYHGANNTELKVLLKAGENLRFTNLTTEATFEVVESDPSAKNYSYSKGEFKGWYGEDTNEVPAQYTKDAVIDNAARKVSGQITLTNTSFYVYMTNTYELVDVEVEKEFDDANNQDNIRPSKITVNLLADGKTAKDTEGNDIAPVEVTIDADGKGSYKFTGLPRFNSTDGKDIVYTITENAVEGYTTSIEDTREKDQNGNITTVGKFSYKITNTHEPATRQIKVKKVWDDDNNRDGIRSTAVITLKADGTATSNVLSTLVDEEVTFTVPVNKARTEESPEFGAIVYSVTEAPITVPESWTGTGYTTEITGNADTGFVVTNKHEPAKTTSTVTKIWDDENNRDNVRPASLTVTLHNDKDSTTTDYTLNADNKWTITLDDLNANINVDGTVSAISYYWTEPATLSNGYTLTSTAQNGNNTTFTNSRDINTTTIKVSKVWVDENNRDNKRTQAVITLNADGTPTSNVLTTLVDEEVSFTVPVNKARAEGAAFGGAITYSVTENTIAEYTTEITGNATSGFVVTNTHTADTKQIKVSKVWDDQNNRDNKRTNAVITLNADGVATSNVLTTLTDETATYTVPVNKERAEGAAFGGAITYSVTENTISGYTTQITGNEKDGFVVTNSRDIDTTTITVTKVWDDESNRDGKRKEAIITLNADGVATTNVLRSLANDTDTATYTVPVNKERTTESPEFGAITYTVTENTIEGYKTTISGSASQGFTVTNEYTPEKTSRKITKVWDDKGNQDGVRPEKLVVTLSNYGDVELNATNKWTATINDLPVHKNNNGTIETIEYIWTEDETALEKIGYKLTKTEINEDRTETTLTNSYKPEVTSSTIIKVWDDDEDRDGARPDTLTVTLSNYGDVELKATENWTATIEDLPVHKNNNGTIEDIEYVWSEKNVPEGYKVTSNTTSGTVTTIKNSHEIELTSITATKDWDDNDNQDGLRTESVTIELLANGKSTGVYKDADASTNPKWTVTFENLKKNENGQPIVYSVQEYQTPEGYTPSVSGNAASGFTIKNTHTPEETEVTITKVWDDEDNHDGMRPKDITLTLKADGTAVTGVTPTKTVSEDGNTWTYTYSNLPKHNGSTKDIVYTIEEAEVDGYEGKIDGYTITNTHKRVETEVEVVKEWKDNSNQDGIRPKDGIEIQLLADGKVVQTHTLNDSGNVWSYKFEHLDKYRNENGTSKEIVYTVNETTVPEGYEKSVSGLKITNTHDPATKTISGTKSWVDDNDRDGIRPDEITINLLANGEPAKYSDGTAVPAATAKASEGWTYSFENLPIYSGGEKISYSVSENLVSGYSSKLTITDDTIDIENTHEIDKITIKGTKIWDDADDQDGKRPGSITVNLMKDGKVYQTTTASAETDWAWSFVDVPKNENGSAIQYKVEEIQVDEYNEPVVKTIAENEYTITNTHTPETIQFTIAKGWEDDDDRDGIRPVSVTVHVLANGKEVASHTITKDEGWTWTTDKLPKYEKGKAITYSITEDVVEGYEPTISTIDENTTSVTITNTHTPEETELDITKTWEEDQFYLDRRPDMIEVDIYADGIYLDTIKVRKEDNWTAKVTNLYKYSNGVAITYTVKEKSVVDGYVSEVSGTQEGGYTITNIFVDGEGCTDCELPPATRIDVTYSNGEKYEEYYTFVTLLLGAVALSSVRKFEM